MTDTQDAPNSGWKVHPDDTTAGDRKRFPPGLDGDGEVLVVELPSGPVEERDPGDPPGCAFCNPDSALEERLWENIRNICESGRSLNEALDDGVDPRDFTKDDFVIPADYALVQDAEVVAFACHSCIQG